MSNIQDAVKIFARLIPFFTLCLSMRFVNLKKEYRYRQVLMPIAAFIFACLSPNLYPFQYLLHMSWRKSVKFLRTFEIPTLGPLCSRLIRSS